MQQAPSRALRASLVALLGGALLLTGCESSQPAVATVEARSNIAVVGDNPADRLKVAPRPKPSHAKPLASMTCVEVHEALLDYRGKMAALEADPGVVTGGNFGNLLPGQSSAFSANTTLALGLAGGLLGILTAAAIAEEKRLTYKDTVTLYREALPVYEARDCAAEVARVRAEAAAQWERMAKWTGDIEVDEVGAYSASPRICGAVALRLIIGIEHDLVRGSLTMPAASAPGRNDAYDVPLHGRFDTTNKTLKIKSEGQQIYRFEGSLQGGRWRVGTCIGTFTLKPLPA